MSTSNNLTLKDPSRGSWTSRDVGVEQHSETGRWRISASEPDSLTADARAKPFRKTLPAHMTFDEVVRFREERMHKAERDWEQVRAHGDSGPRRRTASGGRPVLGPPGGRSRRVSGNGAIVARSCGANPIRRQETASRGPSISHWTRRSRRSGPIAKQSSAPGRPSGRRDATRGTRNRGATPSEERESPGSAKARPPKHLPRHERIQVPTVETDPETGRTNRHWVRPPAYYQTLESVERFRKSASARMKRYGSGSARRSTARPWQTHTEGETSISIGERNISKVWEGDGRPGVSGLRESRDPKRAASKSYKSILPQHFAQEMRALARGPRGSARAVPRLVRALASGSRTRPRRDELVARDRQARHQRLERPPSSAG